MNHEMPSLASANPAARVVDLAAYREARRREHERLPLFVTGPVGREPGVRRTLSPDDVAHRERMLRHLTGQR